MAELASLEARLSKNETWNNQSEARELHTRFDRIKTRLEEFHKAQKRLTDVGGFLELLNESHDPALETDVAKEMGELASLIDRMEADYFLSGEYDHLGAILSIHPGAGGTEAQDWAAMLLRMYLRWAETRGFKTELVDQMPGEEAGIKSATVMLDARYAWLNGRIPSSIAINLPVNVF